MLHHLRAPALAVSIGEAARRCGLTARAIRLYEDHGLVRVGRDDLGVRRYTGEVLDDLKFVAAARRAGLAVSEIGELLEVGRAHGLAARHTRTVEACGAHAAALHARLGHLRRLAGAGLEDAAVIGTPSRRRNP